MSEVVRTAGSWLPSPDTVTVLPDVWNSTRLFSKRDSKDCPFSTCVLKACVSSNLSYGRFELRLRSLTPDALTTCLDCPKLGASTPKVIYSDKTRRYALQTGGTTRHSHTLPPNLIKHSCRKMPTRSTGMGRVTSTC